MDTVPGPGGHRTRPAGVAELPMADVDELWVLTSTSMFVSNGMSPAEAVQAGSVEPDLTYLPVPDIFRNRGKRRRSPAASNRPVGQANVAAVPNIVLWARD